MKIGKERERKRIIKKPVPAIPIRLPKKKPLKAPIKVPEKVEVENATIRNGE